VAAKDSKENGKELEIFEEMKSLRERATIDEV
jgi:hypothetical protein